MRDYQKMQSKLDKKCKASYTKNAKQAMQNKIKKVTYKVGKVV